MNAWVHTYTKPQTSSTRSRGLGWRIHESVEDTKLSTNKQHSLSHSWQGTPAHCSSGEQTAAESWQTVHESQRASYVESHTMLVQTLSHHFKENSKTKVPWAVEYQNDGLWWISPLDTSWLYLSITIVIRKKHVKTSHHTV